MFSVVSGGLITGSGGGGSGGGLCRDEQRLDAMNAVCVYVSTAQLVLQTSDMTDNNSSSVLGEQRILDLTRLFGQLRQLLSCAVCARLLNDPYAPLNNARCQHNVCRLCVRGRKALRPLCISCKDLQDFKTYVENKTMRCLLLCYKSLCEHLLSSNFYVQLSRQKAHQALTCSGENVFGVASMPHMTTCGDIIQEGARYEDILNVFSSDLPQVTPTMGKMQPQTQQQPSLLLNTTTKAVAPAPSASMTSTAGGTIQTPSLSISAVTPLAPLSTTQKRVYNTATAPRLTTPPNPVASAITNNSPALLPMQTHNTIIKLESTDTHHTTTPHSNAHLVITPKLNTTLSPIQHQQQLQTLPNHQQQPHQTHTPTQMVYIKNLKSIVNESKSNTIHHQSAALCNAAQSNVTGNNNNNVGITTTKSSAPAITYVGPNTPGIVVPIVSSSATTTAPLTIASAKLQSLKRQLAQAQARGGVPLSIASAVKAAGSTHHNETHAPITFKTISSASAPSASTAATVSTSIAVESAPSTATLMLNTSNATFVSSSNTTVSTTSNTASTITSQQQHQQQQIRNPPSIKTVSNGSAMYSVLYTGVGNKITIKRKTDGDDESGQRKSVATSITSTSSSPIAVTSALHITTPSNSTTTTTTTATTQLQANANKLNAKRRGCRCGNATPTPGKLTCCGQRCPCYVDSKSCIGCKCRGCRNPHRPDGGKVRPVIPELACYEIQMADDNPSLSPSELQVGNALTTRTHTISSVTATSPLQLSAQQQQPATLVVSDQQQQQQQQHSNSSSSSVTSVSSQLHLASSASSSPSSKGATLIPFISLHPISSQASQQNQQHQQQQQTQSITTISSNQQQNNMLPLESVLIQNAEGKYQVVNVLTTTASHNQQNNSTIQRIHSIPQLQIASSANTNSNNSTGTMTTVNIISGTSNGNNTTVSSPTIVTTKGGATQSILLQQQQQQQHHVNRIQHQFQQKNNQQLFTQRFISSNIITTTANDMTTTPAGLNNTIPIQIQQQQQHHRQQQQLRHNQQLKSNIITMRSTNMHSTNIINNNNNSNSNSNHTATHTFTPILTSNASANTITLSPIIMSSSSPNTFKTELFSDSSESDYMNLTTSRTITSPTIGNGNNTNNCPHNILSTIYSQHSALTSTPTTTRITSVPSLSSGSTGSTSGSSASRMSLGMSMNIAGGTGAHITPALVEVIEASDL